MKNFNVIASVSFVFLFLINTQAQAAECAAGVAATAEAPCDCGDPATSITSGFCVDGQALQACANGVAATANCVCGTGETAATMDSGRTCSGGAIVPLPAAPPLPAVTATAPVVSDYQWQGTPIILKTSQIYAGAEKRQCGNQEYEICVGPATHKTNEAAPVLIVKCFIPKNQTVCPVIKAGEQCSISSAGAPTAAGTIPACDSAHPSRDNLTYGCTCEKYGRRNHVRQTAAICRAEMNARIRQAAAEEERVAKAACTSSATSSECTNYCRNHAKPFCPPPVVPACTRSTSPVTAACMCGTDRIAVGGTCAPLPPPPTCTRDSTTTCRCARTNTDVANGAICFPPVPRDSRICILCSGTPTPGGGCAAGYGFPCEGSDACNSFRETGINNCN
ncbi:MAG: hypothetical protein HYV97_15020 [Bdellovibrio sp.]|nr:hypothetical protein [Bdellovibrio sp.]